MVENSEQVEKKADEVKDAIQGLQMAVTILFAACDRLRGDVDRLIALNDWF
jgi:hypothetical protein